MKQDLVPSVPLQGGDPCPVCDGGENVYLCATNLYSIGMDAKLGKCNSCKTHLCLTCHTPAQESTFQPGKFYCANCSKDEKPPQYFAYY